MNAKVSLSDESLTVGSVAKYTCDTGYELFGTGSLACNARGKWQGDLPFCGTNVGFRKPANQSTTVRGGNANHGNDGDFSTEHDGKRCTETQSEPSPWWRVDLLKPYSVKVVRVTTRGCCGHQPLQDIEIRVGNSSAELQRNPLCAWFPGTIEEGITKTFICARALVGQYVFLQLVGVEGSLSLCEVEVFATDEFSIDRCAHAGTPADADLTAFNSTCYEFIVKKGGSFQEARNYCKNRGGDLVHGFQGVSSIFILNNLERRKDKLKTQLVWIGAQKEPQITARTWRWVDGEIVQKPSWGKDQPNNYNGEQNCVVLDGGRGWLWNDVGCNLDYLHWICQSRPPICGSPEKSENTTIVGSKRVIGSTIEYVCPDGYMLLGSKSRMCGPSGFWSGDVPTCKFVDCGVLPDLENGAVTLLEDRTTHGALADYTCKENYTLVGDTRRRCGDGGIWSGHQPQCLFDWCPEPPEVNGGIVTTTGRRVNSTATYSCQNGFILFGDNVLTCNIGGEWSGKTPQCRFVDCGAPAQIEFGTVVLTNGTTTVSSLAVYTCQEDYWLVGEGKQKCTKEGKWSHDTPSCELITCEEPEVPAGGYVVGYDLNVHSVIEYHCDVGYLLHGEARHSCGKDGEWTGEVPSCESLKVLVSKLRMSISSKQITSPTANLNKGIIIKWWKCVLTCNIGGEWSGKTPQCRFVDCGAPAQIEFGTVVLTNGTTTVSSLAVYTCQEDYWLVGEGKQECTKEGKWSHDTPSCELITCEEPEVPAGGYVVGYDLNVHSVIEYHCDVGYLLHGEARHSCGKDGEWTGEVPSCEYIDCAKVLPVLNGAVDYANGTTHLGSEITYSCTRNYRLNGVSRRYCLDNGQWSDATPKCEEIRCTEPVLAEHGILSVTGNDRMYGRTLIRTGTAENSNTGATSYKIGALVKYRCERGYKVVGEPLSTCEENGKWSGEVPQCVYVDCGKPEHIQHGHYTLTSNATYYGAAALYECDGNFELDGFARRLCLENGTWSSDTPVCREIRCKDPEKTGVLSTQVSTHSVGGVAHYSCPRGFYMEGNETRICLQNGSWSGTTPACFSVDCKHPGPIENGRVIIVNGSTTYGGAAEYHCLPQYERVGIFLRKCLDTGFWSGEEPKCQLAANEVAEPQGVGTSVGIGAGVIIFILIILGLVYLRLRKATPVKNTENVQAAERKEDQNAAVMSYATLNDGTPNTMYENVPEDGLYDNPYSLGGNAYRYNGQPRRTYGRSGHYEAEPVPNRNGITINGVSVR
ncbi:sushi, von Willebrand factor type A, EGF and pentraxin domain-containing protein 1 [Formica exsecta]|uniref:sushi, von Willebrand factor type A, EGF and pentraxin domain-containing protein 1 n=1 Tax=Formica exsecta TaxID=72781 RepID=UPI0011417A4F|nr:sushi, von Willebrand factor type A, EGF and pentraxin domain-containing protein 1 [Formica exsecta]